MCIYHEWWAKGQVERKNKIIFLSFILFAFLFVEDLEIVFYKSLTLSLILSPLLRDGPPAKTERDMKGGRLFVFSAF